MEMHLEVLLPAMAVTAIRMWFLSRRARDGRWSRLVADHAAPRGPYREPPRTARAAIAARPPIVIVTGLSTMLASILGMELVVSFAYQFAPHYPHQVHSHLGHILRSACLRLTWSIGGSSGGPPTALDAVGLAAWAVAAVALWRAGDLMLRSGPKAAQRGAFAGALTLALTAATDALNDRTLAIFYPGFYALLSYSVATSVSLLLVSLLSRRAVAEGTAIGADRDTPTSSHRTDQPPRP